MSILKIKKGPQEGKYRVRIQPVDPITGKRVTIPVEYADTHKEAKAIEKAMWNEYKANIHLGEADAVFADSFQRYVNQRANSVSPVTLKNWQDSANAFKKYFGKAKIKNITTALVSRYAHDYVSKHKVTVSKSSTIAKRLVYMRNFFNSIKGISENPVPEAPLKVFFRKSEFSISKDWYIFTDDQLRKIRELIQDDLEHSSVMNWGSKLAILIESYTGLRIGELQAIKFSNIVFENNVWTLKINDSWSDYLNDFNGSLKARPRGAYRILLPLPEHIVLLLKRYQDKQASFIKEHELDNSQDLIFINLHNYKSISGNQPIKQKSMNDMLREICKKLDIHAGDKRLSMYSFRHTICTKLANTPGMSYPWAAEKMGHSLQMFMNTYVGVNPDIDKQMTQLLIG